MVHQNKRMIISVIEVMCVAFCLTAGIHQSAAAQSAAPVNAFHIDADNVYLIAIDNFKANNRSEYKSKSRAVLYSVAATAIPVGLGFLIENEIGALLIGTGVAVGPSVGITYADDFKRAATGMAVRATGAGISLAGFLISLDDIFSENSDNVFANALIISGYAIIGTSAIYDIFFESAKAVGRYNENLERRSMRLNPWINTETGGAGISLKVQF